MNRREFLTTAAAGAGLAAITGCGDGDVSGLVRPVRLPPGPLVITVGDFASLANPEVLVHVPGTFVAVKRVDATTFLALTMVCTHQNCATNVVNGERLECPCHSSRFDSNGAVINGPFTGEAIGPLRQLPTSYDPATDELTITA